MLNEYFRLYCKNNIDLARSIVIKSDVSARLINRDLYLRGESVDELDPTTWKYYLNLSGEYYIGNHPVNPISDTVMRIRSADSGSEIDYTKNNLAFNPLTRTSIDSYIEGLTEQYPNQENLIHYIRNPIDINDAINADDFQILYYDGSLIASNELTLMDRIQKWIYDYKDRWYKEDFQISDPYYVSAFLGVMYLKLPSVIMNFRLAMCGTPEVDDYHLWNYLNDHYNLGKYRSALSSRQALWLYRNLVDIQRNAGKEWVLKELIDNLAVPKGLVAKIYDYVKEDPSSFLSGMGDGGFIEREYGETLLSTDDQPLVNHENILLKTRDAAIKNRSELDADIQELETKIYYEKTYTVPTNLIQFNLDTNSLAKLASDVIPRIEYWLYLSTLNRYNATHTFNFPNNAPITLTAKDAFILYEYARHARSGIHLNEVIPLVARGVVTYEPITVSDFRDHVPEKYIEDTFIEDALFDRIPTTSVTDVASLELYVEEIISRKIRHNTQVNWINELIPRAHALNVVEGVYDNYTCVMAPLGTTYNDWLSDKGIRRFSMSNFDWQTVMLECLLKFTGINPDNVGIGTSRQAMIDIIDELTSYGLIITNGTGAGIVNPLPFPFLYTDKTKSSVQRTIKSNLGNIRFIDNKAESCRAERETYFDISLLDSLYGNGIVIEHRFDPCLDFSHEASRDEVGRITIPSLTVKDV